MARHVVLHTRPSSFQMQDEVCLNSFSDLVLVHLKERYITAVVL